MWLLTGYRFPFYARTSFWRVLAVIFFAVFALSLFLIVAANRVLVRKSAALEEAKMAYFASEAEKVKMFAAMDWMAQEQMRMEWEMRVRDIKRDDSEF